MLPLWITLGVVGGYIATSAFFCRFPYLIHRKKKQIFKCKHISHRGGAGENLENTLTAFRHAVHKCGTNMLEIDVHLTADGKVVVAHDNNLDRITGCSGLISDYNYNDLPKLCETLDVTFSHEGESVTCCNGDRQIPLLRSVFEEFPDIPMNIDLKIYDEELIDKTIDLIREFQREKLVIVGNFSHHVVDYVHKKAPELPLLFSMRRIIWTTFFFYLGLLPFVPLKEDFFEIPLPRIILRNPHSFQNIRWLIRLADWLLISPVLFRHLQRRGLQVYIFVINVEEDFKVCFEKLKVDGIMTDYPTKLRQFVDKLEADEKKETEPILLK